MGLWVDDALASLRKHPTTPERTAVLKLLMTWRAESLASLQYTAESKQKYAEAIAIREELVRWNRSRKIRIHCIAVGEDNSLPKWIAADHGGVHRFVP